MISRFLKITGFFCKRALVKRRYFATETYNLKEPTHGSHHIDVPCKMTVELTHLFTAAAAAAAATATTGNYRVCVCVCVYVYIYIYIYIYIYVYVYRYICRYNIYI